jgi:hypothetical protein
MGLAGLKTISILFLIVLVALAGVSPVFARDGAGLILTPTEACPGATISVVALFDGTSPGGPVFTSDPAGIDFDPALGLPTQPHFCDPYGSSELDCAFVLKSASCGHYTVTLTATTSAGPESLDAEFDVAGPCCPAVGGCVQPVNNFALLSPWLAVIGLVGCIGTVAVVAKKRRQ